VRRFRRRPLQCDGHRRARDGGRQRRSKTNIQPIDNALAKVQKLRGVSYDRKKTGKHESE
jgi:hypothetical protein